jgi:hypothetical protein
MLFYPAVALLLIDQPTAIGSQGLIAMRIGTITRTEIIWRMSVDPSYERRS